MIHGSCLIFHLIHAPRLTFVGNLGTSPERKAILGGFLDFRDRLRSEGMIQGFQWLDGSFLENIEVMESRPPKDLDVVTFFWGYDFPFQVQLSAVFPEFANPTLAKASFSLDHYPVDAGYSPAFTVESSSILVAAFLPQPPRRLEGDAQN